MKEHIIDDLADRLASMLPKGVQELREDFEKNARAVLNSAFSKMELVTREEFDVQSQVLVRTRMKLEAMEKRVTELEQKLLGTSHGSTKPPEQGSS